jgi:protein-S-isoprenylcysteine O-methyltransferase Ste14
MAELVEALGWRVTFTTAVALLALIGGTTLLFLIIGTAADAAGEDVLVLTQILIWGAWLVWLGQLFPRNAERDVKTPCPLPFRRAFTREILLGIAVAFAQMLRPISYGLLGNLPAQPWPSTPLPLIIGGLLAVIGLTVIVLGVSALGIARALFVYEYVSTSRVVRIDGIYRVLRHPLFLGGTAVSAGLAISTGDSVAVWLAAINVGVVPIYARLEDRRCCTVLGQAYVDYRATVGGMIPRLRSAILWSARADQVSGIARPKNERDFVAKR